MSHHIPPPSPLLSAEESTKRDNFLWKAALMIGEQKPSLARYMLKDLDRGRIKQENVGDSFSLPKEIQKPSSGNHGTKSEFHQATLSALNRMSLPLSSGAFGGIDRICPQCHSLLSPGKSCRVELAPVRKPRNPEFRTKEGLLHDKDLQSLEEASIDIPEKRKESRVIYTCKHCGEATYFFLPAEIYRAERSHIVGVKGGVGSVGGLGWVGECGVDGLEVMEEYERYQRQHQRKVRVKG